MYFHFAVCVSTSVCMRVLRSASSAQSGVGASAPSCPSVEMSVSSRSEVLVVDGDLVVAHERRRLLQERVVAPAALVLQLAQLFLEGRLVLHVQVAQGAGGVVDYGLEIRLGTDLRPRCRGRGRLSGYGQVGRCPRRGRLRPRLFGQRLISLRGTGGRRGSCRCRRLNRLPRRICRGRWRSLPQRATAHVGHNANREQRPQS